MTQLSSASPGGGARAGERVGTRADEQACEHVHGVVGLEVDHGWYQQERDEGQGGPDRWDSASGVQGEEQGDGDMGRREGAPANFAWAREEIQVNRGFKGLIFTGPVIEG